MEYVTDIELPLDPMVRGNTARSRFLRHQLALVGLAIIGIVALAAVAAPVLTSISPNAVDLGAAAQGPSLHHLLGTDPLGRDNLSRLLYGARTSLIVGFGAEGISIVIGILLGAAAGYFGGVVDQVVGRLVDTVMSLPALLIVIVFVSVIGPSLQSVVVVIALLTWPGATRLMRGQVLAVREAEFISAARVIGLRPRTIIARHLFPNTLGPMAVLGTLGVANAILIEAGLSFLGLGVRPPASSWGSMIGSAESTTVLTHLPWAWVPPAICLGLTVLAITFVGDGLRDALDPRSGA